MLIMWPMLLQVVFNQKLRNGKDYLSVNTLKNTVMLNLLCTIKKKKKKSHSLVTEKASQLAGKKMLQEGHNHKMTKQKRSC